MPYPVYDINNLPDIILVDIEGKLIEKNIISEDENYRLISSERIGKTGVDYNVEFIANREKSNNLLNFYNNTICQGTLGFLYTLFGSPKVCFLLTSLNIALGSSRLFKYKSKMRVYDRIS